VKCKALRRKAPWCAVENREEQARKDDVGLGTPGPAPDGARKASLFIIAAPVLKKRDSVLTRRMGGAGTGDDGKRSVG